MPFSDLVRKRFDVKNLRSITLTESYVADASVSRG